MFTRVEAICAKRNFAELRQLSLMSDDGWRTEHDFFIPITDDVPPIIRIGESIWRAGQVSGASMLRVWYDKINPDERN